MEDIEKHYGIDRYNILDYLKSNNRKYAPIPDHIINCIKEETQNERQPIISFLGVYIVLYLYQDDYNKSNLSTREKTKTFFGLSDVAAKQILDKLEEIGVIVQKREHRKKIIIVKYPEYINDKEIKSIEFTEEVTTVKKTVKVNYNEKQNNVENYLDEYINWKNSKEQIIKNPAGFKKAYYKNPGQFDFSDYEEYKKRKHQKQLMELRRQEQLKKDIEQQKQEEKEKQERIKIFQNIEKLKNENPEKYNYLYQMAENEARQNPETNSLDEKMFHFNVRNVYLPNIYRKLF